MQKNHPQNRLKLTSEGFTKYFTSSLSKADFYILKTRKACVYLSTMKPDKLHIEEENIQLFWGLIALVSIALGTYMLTNAFMAGSWSLASYSQITSLILFSIGFFCIIKVSSPLYRFVLSVEDSILTIEIWNEGDQPLDVKERNLNEIEELRISPHSPRLPGEALFDFSSSYHLLYRKSDTDDFEKLINLEGATFTLKVEDIGRIMKFMISHNPNIYVPESDAVFVKLSHT